MAGKKKRCSRPGYKAMFGRYKDKNSVAKNRLRDLVRHVKKHPEDEQAVKDLERLQKNPKPYKKKPVKPLYPKMIVKELPDGKKDIQYYSRDMMISISKASAFARACKDNPTFWMSKEQKTQMAEKKRLFGKDTTIGYTLSPDLAERFKKTG